MGINTKGVRKTATGWQAYVHLPDSFKSKRFPPDITLTAMKRWREEQRVRSRLGAALPTTDNTLAEDISHYLSQVQTMPTLRDRRDDLNRWLEVFGPERDRRTIAAGEIRAQLERWRTDGYAASTCNHRRTALMHLWTVLDGRTAPNPARDVPRYPSEVGPPRALSFQAITLLLDAMPPSQTKARLTLMAWTGLPHSQMMRLTPQDIDWDRALFVRPRRKGRGALGVWLPLLPQAWTALREFKRLGCWGRFSQSSMRQALRRAAKRVLQDPDITPYQLRHSFGTLVASITQDDRAVQTLLQHSDIRQTHRYTQASVDPRVVAALSKVADVTSR